MGHLNELQEKYGEKGLSIVAVAKQAKADVQKYVDELGAKFPTVCESSDSMANYGANSYPSAFLIGANGRILWAGHPASLPDSSIQSALEGARLLPALPESLSSHQKNLEKLKYGAALSKVAGDLEKGRVAEEDKPAAEALRDWLTWYAQSAMEGAAADVEKGECYRAALAYDDLEETFKGHDFSKQAKDALKALESDKDKALEIKAGKMWAEIRREIAGEQRPDKVLDALKPLLSKKYAETKAGLEAAAMADEAQKRAGGE